MRMTSGREDVSNVAGLATGRPPSLWLQLQGASPPILAPLIRSVQGALGLSRVSPHSYMSSRLGQSRHSEKGRLT